MLKINVYKTSFSCNYIARCHCLTNHWPYDVVLLRTFQENLHCSGTVCER